MTVPSPTSLQVKSLENRVHALQDDLFSAQDELQVAQEKYDKVFYISLLLSYFPLQKRTAPYFENKKRTFFPTIYHLLSGRGIIETDHLCNYIHHLQSSCIDVLCSNFYAPASIDLGWGDIVLLVSVCRSIRLSVCLSVLTFFYNFHTIQDIMLIFSMQVAFDNTH